jgi:hypothetical protein
MQAQSGPNGPDLGSAGQGHGLRLFLALCGDAGAWPPVGGTRDAGLLLLSASGSLVPGVFWLRYRDVPARFAGTISVPPSRDGYSSGGGQHAPPR